MYDKLDITEFTEEGYLPDDEKEIGHNVSTNNMLIYTTAD